MSSGRCWSRCSTRPGKRGPKQAPDLRQVVDGMLYISHTGCQWRFLPESFGPWTRVFPVPPLVAQWHLGSGMTVLQGA